MAAPRSRRMAAIFNIKLMLYVVMPCLFLKYVQSARLSDPKILLPYHSSAIVNYTLHVNLTKDEVKFTDSSCFTWSSNTPETASVTLVNSTDGECAFSAVVSVVSKSPHRKQAIIMTENKVTGEKLKCIVIVKSMFRFEIQTTTRSLYLEDSPEELVIQGYDDAGNMFSSLAGLEFEWSLLSDADKSGAVDAYNILRILRFSESDYTMPSHIRYLEGLGLQGDMILAEGIRTGSAKVKARVKDAAYKNVPPSIVKIMVVANLNIKPAEAYVLKFATVKYRVELVKHTSEIEIKMPSPQFFLEVQDVMICTLDASTSTATATELGSTEIILMDKNIIEDDSMTKPSAMLYVVTVSYLAFVVLPHRKWVLETGREYEILIEVYDKDSHRIHPSDNIVIKAAFPETYFNVHYSTRNGTYHTVTALQRGKTNIDGALTTIIRQDGSEYEIIPQVKQTQEVEIYDPIEVHPPLLYFPWDPVKESNHRYKLKAIGGSGEYIWSSNNLDTTSVNVRGEITTGNLGQSVVTAADTRNQAHKGSATVHVLPPSDMKFAPKQVEAMVTTELELPLAVFGLLQGQKFSFNDCRNMRLNVTFTDDLVFNRVKGSHNLPEEGCRTIKVKAIQKGHTQITASYVHENIKLESSVTIAAYDPLVPVDSEKEAVVTVGSLKEVVFTGGPQPWVLDTSKYFQQMSAEREAIVNVEQVKMYSRGIHSFFVLCKDIGVQKLTLNVGNDKTAKNQYPAKEQATIKFSCAAPVEIHLLPLVGTTKGLPPCPVNSREVSQPIPVHCKRDLDIMITVTDSNGRKFDNFSSLVFDWSLSDHSLAFLSDSISLSTEIIHDRKIVNSYKKLEPVGKTGKLSVTATVTYYSDEYLRLAGASITNRIYPRLTKSIDIVLVDEAVLSPSIISIFNHPSNKVTISVDKGSGFFYVVPEQKGIISLEYQEKNKKIQINPLRDGSLSLTVYDLCITMPQPLTASVYVSGVGSVHLSVIDKVEVNHEVRAKVKVMDVHNKPLRASFFSLMDLKLIPASSIISVRPDFDNYLDEFTAVYILYGAQVGHTTLQAQAHPQTGIVRSQSKPIEVFPPLQLIPKNITLIIGALFQVLSKGGPTPQCTVEFSIKNSKISTVSSSGMLEALVLGSTTVIGQAVGQDPETGERVVYSQDDAMVNVIQMSGIKIYAPLSRLETGTQIPMYAVGQSDQETPFTFGSARPPLLFTWSVNNKDVVVLNNVFHKSNIKPVDDSNFAIQLYAKTPGQVTVKLTVKQQRNSKSQLLTQAVITDELQIQVYQKMTVISPQICDGKLLIAPNSEAVVKTNRDESARMSYQVISTDTDKPIITVNGGVISSGAICGQAHLQITAYEEFGTNQTLVLLIKVKTVSYLMINSDTALKTSSGHLKKIPVGINLHFTISFHDDVGEEFYSTNVKIKYRCNRHDLVQIGHGSDNNTLVLKAAEVGQTVLKVWDQHSPWIADYINIDVDHEITPSKQKITLGQIVCYTSSLITESGYNGKWLSNNNNMKVIDDSGIAVAIRVGSSLVLYEITSGVSTYAEVTIEPIRTVSFDTTLTYLTNVISRKSSYFIPVKFTNEPLGDNCINKLREDNFSPGPVPFSCHLTLTDTGSEILITDLFSVASVFDSKTGKYGCSIDKVQKDKLAQQISTLKSNIRLTVRVPFQEGQSEVISEARQFQFYPEFHVQTKEIHLSTMAPVYNVRVTCVPALESEIKVVVSDSSILEVLNPQVGSIIFPIKLIDTGALWERETHDVHVTLICQKTGQEVKLPVSIRLIGQKPEYFDSYRSTQKGWTNLVKQLFSNYQSWLFIFLLIFMTAVSVLLGYHYILGKRYRAAPNTVLIPAPAGASPYNSTIPYNSTMQNISGSPLGGYSPSTPYLWSTGYLPQDASSSGRKRSPLYRPGSPM